MVLRLSAAPPIQVEIDDVLVEFFGDPPEEALLALLETQAAFAGQDTIAQVRGIGELRRALGGFVLPGSIDAWAGLAAAGKLPLGVVLQLIDHVTSTLGGSLGFRGGSSEPSTDGRPGTGATSEV